MKRLGAMLLPILLLALACGDLGTPVTPLPPDLEATVRAVVAEVQSTPRTTDGPDAEPDTAATITAQVQATVRALLEATPIPSPTPTQSGISSGTSGAPLDPTRSSPVILSTAPAPTATRVPTPTPSPTPRPTPSPTPPAPCAAAADGVEVSAWVNGALAATTLVQSGSYTLQVGPAGGGSLSGQTITFKVGGSNAAQTLVWEQGGATILDLTAPDGGFGRLAPSGTGRPSLAGGPLAQPVPPHVILGAVSVGGC